MKKAAGQSEAANVFRMEGEWTVQSVPSVEKQILQWKQRTKLNAARKVDPTHLEKLDTAGAWLVQKHFAGAEFTAPFDDNQQSLIDFVADAFDKRDTKPSARPHFLQRLGMKTFNGAEFIVNLVAFIGVTFTRLARNFLPSGRFRPASITRHIEETGIDAIPIICILAFGISMVIFYQGATQLQKFGADIFTIDLTIISLLREMAVLTTSIMIAGRSGSAFAAEIGVMKLRGEIDALNTMGIDPIEALVVPRMLALLITLPLLCFLTDLIGIAAGGLMSRFMLDIPFTQYLDRVQAVATPKMFFIGIIKAPFMALLITAVCTFQGIHSKGSAENVGKITTLAVVQSIFLVIMADAVFSILFSKFHL